MKVYIMTDLEGVAGVLDHDTWCQPAGPDYPGRYFELGRELLTREVNACIEGLITGGADEIVVSDGHGAGGILPILLDPRAVLLAHWGDWPCELDATYDAVAWVGQHPQAGTLRGHICHTQWFNYLDQTINGQSIGEFGELALCTSELGVRAIFASGDEALCQEAARLVPGIVTVAVKRGITNDDGHELDTRAYMHHNLGAIHLHPEVARRAICDRARAAMEKFREAPKAFGLIPLRPPFERITTFRPDAPGEPRRIDRATHPKSVIAVLNQPFEPQPVEG